MTAELTALPTCQFIRMIPDAPPPQRANRAADGTMPIDAFRYCEPIRAASGFGYHFCPPMSFSLLLDDDQTFWQYEGMAEDEWIALQRGAQFPNYRTIFAEQAPAELGELAPPFLVQGSLPGNVQIWTGYFARTAPGWSLLVRGVANAKDTQPYRSDEGIVETDRGLRHLFTNVRLTRTNSPVSFHKRKAFVQVQPVLRECYLDPSWELLEADALGPEDWASYALTLKHALNHMRDPGHYAVEARRRAHAEAAP